MIKTGRLCVKIAGRDAGKRCVVLSEPKNNRVLIDGETRRRLCNIAHLEPLPKVVAITSEASHQDVLAALQPLGIKTLETKSKKAAPKPRKLRRSKLAIDKASPSSKSPAKKASDNVQKKSQTKPEVQSESSPAAQPETQASKTNA